MKAIIYFKDAAAKEPLTVEGLISIHGNVEGKNTPKRYNEQNFYAFTPFANESYAFKGTDGIFSISGAEILKVEIKD